MTRLVSVEVDADERMWARIPPSYPSEEFRTAEEWAKSIVDRYSRTRGDAGADELDAAFRIAQHAAESIDPTAAFGLLFWPARAPLAVSLQVDIAAGDDDLDPLAALIGSVPLAHPPAVQDEEIPGFADGISARFLVAVPSTDQHAAVAGVGYLLRGEQCVVRIMSAPTSSTLVGLLDAPLRQLVHTLRVTFR